MGCTMQDCMAELIEQTCFNVCISVGHKLPEQHGETTAVCALHCQRQLLFRRDRERVRLGPTEV
eukprot:4091757-Lingulodinium_polyedra.AAC.1